MPVLLPVAVIIGLGVTGLFHGFAEKETKFFGNLKKLINLATQLSKIINLLSENKLEALTFLIFSLFFNFPVLKLAIDLKIGVFALLYFVIKSYHGFESI